MKSAGSRNRRFSFIIVSLFLLFTCPMSSAEGAPSADLPLSQSGSAQSIDDGQGNYPPVDVNFPQEFGGTPTVALTCPAGWFHGHHSPCVLPLSAANVTSTGFRAVIGQSANRSGTPNGLTLHWTGVGIALQRGTVVPNYMVLTIIYAPPGTGGGHSTSSVSYQSGSTAGTLTSSSRTFKDGNAVSVEVSSGTAGNGGGAGVSFDSSHSSTDSQSLEIKKSTTTTISQVGPSQDGINHDNDEIWLLLKPKINLALSSSTTEWTLADTRSLIQYVHVGWLNGHEPMPPGVASVLQNAGITPQVYPDILVHDPLANGQPSLEAPRFVSINTTFPYEPPYSASDPVPTSTFNISNSQVATTGTTAEDSVKVELYVSGSAGFMGLATIKLKDTDSWEWTNKSSNTTTTGSSQSATLTIGGPAYGFVGPSVIQVYYDTVYRTFAFALTSGNAAEIALTGTLLTPRGAPAVNKRVILTESGKKHLTYTSTKGKFTFFGDIRGHATIQAPGVTQVIPQLQSTRSITLHPK